jgi:hypothetical protein
MKTIVVYESLWGNTAAVARAIAEGIGPDAQALSTAEATGQAIAGADLIVVGAPVHAFSLPNARSRENARAGKAPTPPDLSHPPLREWLDALPKGQGRSAAFETRLSFPIGHATPKIERGLRRAGYHPVAKAQHYVVKGGQGPLRDGELERARQWGAELAQAMR